MKLLCLAMLPLTTVLGFRGVHVIRTSGGRLRGLPLATGMGLLFPILILNWALIAFWEYNLTNPRQLMHCDRNPWLVLIGVLLVLAVDILIVRAVWRRVSRPLPAR